VNEYSYPLEVPEESERPEFIAVNEYSYPLEVPEESERPEFIAVNEYSYPLCREASVMTRTSSPSSMKFTVVV
jgi:hypothetical protein